MKFLSKMLALVAILLTLGARTAQAQGSVSGVTVTTSVTSLTVPVNTAGSYTASVTTGTPQPDKEWQVIGSASYSWSATLGTPNPKKHV